MAGSAGRTSSESGLREVQLTLVGAGEHGLELADLFTRIPGVSFACICDVDAGARARAMDFLAKLQLRRPAAVATVHQALGHPGTRAVVVASPDHWHALHASWAIRAGKDVYLSSPPTLHMRELRWIAEQASSSSSIVQVEMEHRTADNPLKARDLIERGLLGRVYHVRVVNPLPPPADVSMIAPAVPVYEDDDDDDCNDAAGSDKEEGKWSSGGCRAVAAHAQVPAGVDWDAWLGPAPAVNYDPRRHRDWRNFWAHGGGPLLSDGLAPVDLARLVMGEPALPWWVRSIGVSPFDRGGRRRPTERAPQAQAALVQFDGWYMSIESGMGIGHPEPPDENASRAPEQSFWATHPHVEVMGTEATMRIAPQGCGFVVFRSGGEMIAECQGAASGWRHQSEFIQSVRERSAPASSIDAVRSSAVLVHWVNIAYRLGAAQISFDWLRERFTDCEEANKLLQVAYRAPYDHLPATMSPAMAGTDASPA